MADSSAAPGSVRLEWVYTALASVRNSGGVVALCESLGAKYLAAANATLARPGYLMGSHTGPGVYNRHIVNIYTASAEAKASNARNQTLAKLMG
jgi:hypothetical protein